MVRKAWSSQGRDQPTPSRAPCKVKNYLHLHVTYQCLSMYLMSFSFHVAFISGCFLKLIQLQFFSNLSVGLVPIPGFSPAISRLSTLMLPKWLAMHHRIREHLKWGFILQQNAEQLPCLTILLNTFPATEFHGVSHRIPRQHYLGLLA